jgi:hypothetical protein
MSGGLLSGELEGSKQFVPSQANFKIGQSAEIFQF